MRHDGQIALVLEDVPGGSLRRWIESHPQAGIVERLRIAVRLAEIVAEVHTAGVIHKDLSSHNVMYDADTQRLQLIDFGIATRLRSEENKFQAPAALEGTLAYIAPEQTGRMNRSLDYRADLYSLGVTLYELFTGQLPHESARPARDGALPHRGQAGAAERAVEPRAGGRLEHRHEAAAEGARGALSERRRSRGRSRDFVSRRSSAGHDIPPFALGGAGRDRTASSRRRSSMDARQRRSVAAELRAGRPRQRRTGDGGRARGIGKTSLVQEIHQPITRQRGYFIAGKFDQLQQNVPFSALVTAFQDLVQQLLTESEEAIAAWRARSRRPCSRTAS